MTGPAGDTAFAARPVVNFTYRVVATVPLVVAPMWLFGVIG